MHISLPNATGPSSETEAYVQGGKYGIIIAADTRNLSRNGHITDFAGDDTTVIVELPVVGNVAPPHTVLHRGACRLEDLQGLE